VGPQGVRDPRDAQRPAGERGGVDEGLIEHVTRLLAGDERVIIGIVGCPGAGKSTLAEALCGFAAAEGIPAAWVPMDGFHLADVELDRLGRRDRKGALDTFDVGGYLALLDRIARERDRIVYAPAFERELEQPLAGSIPVLPEARLIVTEGNYLLDDDPAWLPVRTKVSETWFVDVDDDVRLERLIARHIRFGKAPDAAREWVLAVDVPNGERISPSRDRADVVVIAAADGTFHLQPRPVPVS
jgi:pantothenate kinase